MSGGGGRSCKWTQRGWGRSGAGTQREREREVERELELENFNTQG